MTAEINQLIEILEQTQGFYHQMLAVIHREKEAALGRDPHQMVTVNVEREEIMARLGQLERKRIILINQMAEKLNLSPAHLTLSALANHADTYQAFRMIGLRDAIGGLMKTIKRANAENRLLIQHCLDLVRGALGFFQHRMMPASVYGSSGQINNGHRNGKLLSGII